MQTKLIQIEIAQLEGLLSEMTALKSLISSMFVSEKIKTPIMPDNVYTQKEVCELFDVEPGTVQKWRREKKIAYSREGSVILFLGSDLIEFLRSKERRVVQSWA